jgi:hypothetical protein
MEVVLSNSVCAQERWTSMTEECLPAATRLVKVQTKKGQRSLKEFYGLRHTQAFRSEMVGDDSSFPISLYMSPRQRLELAGASFIFLAPFIFKPGTAQTQASKGCIFYTKIWSPGFTATGSSRRFLSEARHS